MLLGNLAVFVLCVAGFVVHGDEIIGGVNLLLTNGMLLCIMRMERCHERRFYHKK